jgi:hypothetical protein
MPAEGRRTTTLWGARVNLSVAGSRFWLLARADCLRFLIPFVILPPPVTAAARWDRGGGDGARGGGREGDEVGMGVTILGSILGTIWGKPLY